MKEDKILTGLQSRRKKDNDIMPTFVEEFQIEEFRVEGRSGEGFLLPIISKGLFLDDLATHHCI